MQSGSRLGERKKNRQIETERKEQLKSRRSVSTKFDGLYLDKNRIFTAWTKVK